MISIFRDFIFSEGKRYQELIPDCNYISPNKTHEYNGFEGWAYCARTAEKDLIMVYYEKDCPSDRIRSVRHDGIYRASWFDPRTGTWIDAGELLADPLERILSLPPKPTEDDWGLKLKLIGEQTMLHGYQNKVLINVNSV